MPSRKLILFALFLSFSFSVEAQNTLDLIGLNATNPASVAFSVRQLSSSYTGPLIRARVGTDYYDVYPDASANRELSLSSKISIATTYSSTVLPATTNDLGSLTSSDVQVAIWYDQSGNDNHLKNSNPLFHPHIIKNSSITTANGKPIIYWDGSPRCLRLDNLLITNAQVIVINRFGSEPNADGFLLGTTSQYDYYWHNEWNNPSFSGLFDQVWTSTSIKNGVIHQNGTLMNNWSDAIYNTSLAINSVAPQNPSNETHWDNIGFDRSDVTNQNGGYHPSTLDAGWSELLSFPNTLAESDRLAIENNQAAYFSITVPSSIILTVSDLNAPFVATCSGDASAPQTINVEAYESNSSSPTGVSTVVVTAPAGIELSENANSGYSSSVSLSPNGAGTVSATLYVRLMAGANNISGNIIASSAGANTATTSVSSTAIDPPVFTVNESLQLCNEALYLVELTSPSSYNGWASSDETKFTVNSLGYISALNSGTATLTYTDGCGQSVSQLVTIQAAAPLLPITDGKPAYKFNGNPQGPLGGGATLNYVGYNGYTYQGQTPPSNVGFYKANIQVNNQAGCPYRFYIFSCPNCGN